MYKSPTILSTQGYFCYILYLFVLGQHPSLRGSSKALATVTAIIDGTGSIGAAIGPLLAGALSGNS